MTDNKGANYLTAKIRIGCCKGPVSFKHNQVVFHHDDIPEHARKRASEVSEYKKPKILSVAPSPWNLSMKTNAPICERRTMENFVQDRGNSYQYNYRAESLDCNRVPEPLDKPTKFHMSRQLESTAQRIKEESVNDMVKQGTLRRNLEMPNHPNLDDALSWSKTTVLSNKEKKNSYETMTLKSKKNSKSVSDKLKNYETPMQHSDRMQAVVREQKRNGLFDVKKAILRPASPPVNRNLLTNRHKVEPSRKYKTNKHSGTWELSKFDNRMMWSDTGSYQYESKGDIVMQHNPDAYMMEGLTASRPIPFPLRTFEVATR
jgi:hypothetical protein